MYPGNASVFSSINEDSCSFHIDSVEDRSSAILMYLQALFSFPVLRNIKTLKTSLLIQRFIYLVRKTNDRYGKLLRVASSQPESFFSHLRINIVLTTPNRPSLAASAPLRIYSNKANLRPNLPSEKVQALRVAHPSVNSVVKRVIDIAGALVGLSITAVVVVPVAIATHLDNPGSIFYSQVRCGLRGKPFRIWKFRSMVKNADQLKHLVHNEAQGGIFKNRNDPRVTRIGRFLRKTSLDELPQFWNVLRGEMSLVGTRPPTVEEVIGYRKHHWQRLEVRPGMTGEWQVNGRSTVADFEEIVRLDVAYQSKWSIAYDLVLIIKTIKAVLTHKGAC